MKKLISIFVIALFFPMASANAKVSHHNTSHHSYSNKGWKHHKLTGTRQTRYLHAISRKNK